MILEFDSSEHCRTEDRYADIYKLAFIVGDPRNIAGIMNIYVIYKSIYWN